MQKTLERLRDYDGIDREIEAGHTYAGIILALRFAKDQFQRSDMEATAQALYESSGYIRTVVDNHPDPISFLASRNPDRNSVLVFNGNLSSQSRPEMSNRVREVAV